MKYRHYDVMVKNEETGKIVKMNNTPVLHSEGCTMLSKIANHPWRRKYLVEVPVSLGHDADGLATYKLPFEL